MPTESTLNKVIYPNSQSSKYPPIPKFLKNFHRIFLPLSQTTHPSLLCTCNPCVLLSKHLLASSPHLHECLSRASTRDQGLTSPASYCPRSTAAAPASPPSWPASQPAAPWPCQPPCSPPPRPREDQAGGWESPCLLSLPPSLPLPPCPLPPPPAPEAGTVRIQERGDGDARWGTA